MTTTTKSFRTTTAAALLTCTLLTPAAVFSGPLSLSDTPLFLSNSVEPNILFMVDDSGSMDWGMMTPAARGIMTAGTDLSGSPCHYAYPHPAPDLLFAGGDFYLPMATEEVLKAHAIPAPYGGVWRAWNKDYNKLYYDPSVTYLPWPNYTAVDPTAAPFDPTNPTLVPAALNLTANVTYPASNCEVGYFPDPFDLSTWSTLHPAQYYIWTDSIDNGLVDAADAHTQIKILPGPGTYEGGPSRTDCAAAPNCTYAEEIQNFANWFTYYRKREFTAKAAYGAVIAGASNARMGLGTLHNNNSVNTPIASMNADPTSGAKSTLLSSLYTFNSNGGTPLPSALFDAGLYLADDSKSSSRFNGFANPALPTSNGGECQQNFTVLMTDGIYNGRFSLPGSLSNNPDGDNTSPWDTDEFGPYGDNVDDTLADVAMHFYETDLTGAANSLNPPAGGIDDNTAQHMVTYSVAFGVDGSLSDMPPNRTDAFAWPAPTSDAGRIDDLRHAAWNGRGEFLSAQNPLELIRGLSNSLQSIQGRVGSAASVAFNTGSLSTNSEVYLALFNSQRWNGNLLAFDLDPNTGAINPVPSWSAAAQIDTRNLGTKPRTLLSYDGADGIAFTWSAFGATHKSDFRTDSSGVQGTEASGMARLAYLRGERGCEFSSSASCSYTDGTNTFNTKSLRERGGRLGDIIHSGPVFAGAPESNWPDVAPFPGTVGNTYSEYREVQASRPGVIYVGANDGMLHGFAQANGEEVLGYIPLSLYSSNALEGLHYLTDPAYTHRYTVDLTASIADTYIKTTPTGSASWKTVLVGGLRGGGRGVFALDITDPTSFSESGSAPANTVMWEFTDDDDADLGHTFSRPSIVPLEGTAGTIRWAAIFGNGYNDLGSGEAKLFVLFLEEGLDGTWTSGTDYIEISTGVGDSTTPNGLATPAVVDTDGNGLADRVYAGDLRGNLWAFDLSGTNTGNWAVAYKQGTTPKPLFIATANQQVTSTPVIVRNKSVPTSPGSFPNTLVIFGTGQYLTTGDISTTHTQAMYGVWDSGTRELIPSQLVEQTISPGTSGGRKLTDVGVAYGTEFGWRMDLPDSGERLITDPVIRDDLVFFNTMIPDSNPCNFGGSGWLMVAKWINGGSPDEIAFDFNGDGVLDSLDLIDGESPVGLMVTGIATSPVNLSNKRYTSTTETTGGSSIGVTEIKEIEDNDEGRLSWEELNP